MAEANESKEPAFEDYMNKRLNDSPSLEPDKQVQSLTEVPNGWDMGVKPDADVPASFRGSVCSGLTKPRSLMRFPDEETAG